jgi:hypothetical protein
LMRFSRNSLRNKGFRATWGTVEEDTFAGLGAAKFGVEVGVLNTSVSQEHD